MIAQAFDTPIIGWRGGWANTLRLWGALPTRLFDLERFNQGDFAAAAAPKHWRAQSAACSTRTTRPRRARSFGSVRNSSSPQPRFATFCAALKANTAICGPAEEGRDPAKRYTPCACGPELVRLLHDERGLDFDDAVEIAQNCLSYTNHTLLPEALERWPEAMMDHLLPRHLMLIERIDAHHAKRNPTRNTTVRDNGEIKMGDLSFIMAHRVNGVSQLHTELMKKTVFRICTSCIPSGS